jgi:hypothetical protein
MLAILFSIQLPFSFAIMLCYLNADPFSFILPNSHNLIVILISFVFRIFFLILTCYSVWYPVARVLLFSIIFLKMLKKTCCCLLKWTELQLTDNHKPRNMHTAGGNNIKPQTQTSQRLPRKVPIRSIFLMHIRTRKLVESASEAYYYLFPSMLLFGLTIFVLTNYATIKMHSTIPMPFYLLMPTLSIFAVIMISILFPNASHVHESSLEFLRSINLIVGGSKYWRKVWRAQRPLSIFAGPFFPAKRSTKTTFFYQCIDFTVNGLMLT